MDRRIFLLASLSLVIPVRSIAQTFARRGITVEAPWAKPSVGEAAAMFMTLRNDGPRADRLMGGSTPIAERVILRELDGTAMDHYDLQPKRPVSLRPGRRYIALRGLKRILAVDDTFPVTLRFAEAGNLDIVVTVAEGPDDG